MQLLLVEDDPGDVLFFKEVFRSELGTTDSITHVENVRSAIDMLNLRAFDLIILDLCLPGSRGLATLDSILAFHKGLPIIVLTGINDERTGCEAIRKGAQDFLCKDQVDGKSLVRTLRFAYERSRIRDMLARYTRDSSPQTEKPYPNFMDRIFKGAEIYKEDTFHSSGF